MSFTDKLYDATELARLRIVEVLTARGTNYQLIDPSDIEDDEDDINVDGNILFNLPNSIKHFKHGLNERCGITVINIDNDKRLTFEGVSLESRSDEVFEYNELDLVTICEIADLVDSLESGT